jgi:hypothetical protein
VHDVCQYLASKNALNAEVDCFVIGPAARHRDDLIVKPQNSACKRLHPKSQFSKTQSNCLPDEKIASHNFLQSLDLCADGRLRELQFFGCFAETAMIGYRRERTKQLSRNVVSSMPKVHSQDRIIWS